MEESQESLQQTLDRLRIRAVQLIRESKERLLTKTEKKELYVLLARMEIIEIKLVGFERDSKKD
jgi:hypothetical protein